MPKPLLALFLALLLSAVPGAHAWGPHSEITQAAVDTLPPDAPLRRLLGSEISRLREYCWMGDLRRTLRRENPTWFYADDFLLFPALPKHLGHICPEVKATYEPTFRRALQALRTETPLNAARWLGAVMHFTEDTGSPPHAAEILGELHTKMENWVQGKAVLLPGYQPQLLGATDEEALAGYLRRMDGLIAFSRERAERVKPLIAANNRAATEPIVLESALETARVVADLLHTLGVRAAEQPSGPLVQLGGVIESEPSPGLEKVPVKVVLLGTNYSTLADLDGRFVFHHLPGTHYEVAAYRAGSEPNRVVPQLSPGVTADIRTRLLQSAPPGNLLRNPDFSARWLAEDRPEGWYPSRRREEGPRWESDLVPLTPGTTYRLKVEWQPGATGQVAVHLYGKELFASLGRDLPRLNPGEPEATFTAEGEFKHAHVSIYCEGTPERAVKAISLVPVPSAP